ncbi:MAG TPA: Gfo/Idh/MocA family oxidoreductase [Candidatus Eisenbacteria bacterium]|nr:Gfo/Idh/MocA family oxidoreductase [Candidatus Eisenbacteria bacterium]
MRIGVLGAGRIGAFHARTLAANPLVEGLVINDPDQARAERLARELGAERAPSPEALVEAGVDALVIAAATPAHAPLLHVAANAHLPTFCEKPIALDLHTTDDVLEHVAASGILLQVGFQRRFDPGYRAAREAVRGGGLGELYLVRVAGHDPEPPPEEYVAASGGIWRDLLIHDFDVVPWVVDREVVEVYADGTARSELFDRHDDVDTAAAVLRFSGGLLGVVSGSRHDPLGYDIRLELFGSRDSIAVGLDEHTPLRSVEPNAPASRALGYRDFMERFGVAYRAELQAFLEAVRDDLPSPCGGEEARRALRLALTAERSRAQHRPVAIWEVG